MIRFDEAHTIMSKVVPIGYWAEGSMSVKMKSSKAPPLKLSDRWDVVSLSTGRRYVL
jgi:hypothetical protein